MIKDVAFKLIEYPQHWHLIADDWLNLYHQCHKSCVFYHAIFIEAGKVLPPHMIPTHIVLGYQGDLPVFGVPIILKKFWGLFNQISFFGGIGFDHLSPLDSTEDFTATQEFFSYVKENFHPAVIQGNALDSGYKDLCERICSEKRLSIFIRPFFRCPYLLLPDNPKELLSNLDKNFHPHLSRSLRRAEKLQIKFRFLTGDSSSCDLEKAFHNLCLLHANRFKSLDQASMFLETIPQNYFKTINSNGLSFQNIIWFTEATHQGKVIGSLFGFLTNNRFHFFQMGFASEYNKFSVGTLLIYQTMTALIKKKMYLFDFLRGMEAYKMRWTKTIAQDFYIIIGTSFLGRAFLEWLRLQRSIKRHGRLYGVRYRLLNKD